MEIDNNTKLIIRKYTIQNALQHSGQAQSKAVISKILGENPELRQDIKELIPIINQVVAEINSQNVSKLKIELEELAPELLHKEKREKKIILPELPNVKAGSVVVMRFAPGPSGPLHIGHSRAIVLNDAYVRRYQGRLIIRFEDTNPHNIEPTAYDMIPEDLDWLGIKYHKLVKQSDRFDVYYQWARELIAGGHAYICTCPVETWRNLKMNSEPCPDRDTAPEENLSRWQKMLDRDYEPGAASMVIKTDLHHPNPAVRDFVGMRMVADEHPLTKDKYYVYPTYNLSVAIDDHLMDITHILRGKDHLNNTYRQKYIYQYLAWPTPEFLHYGWISLPDVLLKTTTIKDGIKSGKYTSWSDIHLGTLQALAQRGIQPEAIKKYWLDVGIKEVDIEFSWQTLYALNKDLIHEHANRYFFVEDPVTLIIQGVDTITGHAPLHPDDLARGFRDTTIASEDIVLNDRHIKGIPVLIPRGDLNPLQVNAKLRLKDLCNVELTKIDLKAGSEARYIGNDLAILKQGAQIIHWVSKSANYPAIVHHPDRGSINGYCEVDTETALGEMIQFERFGFVKLGKKKEPAIEGWFAHK